MKTFKNLKKQAHALLLLGLVSLTFVGCGKNNTSGGSNSNTPVQPINGSAGGSINTNLQSVNILRQNFPCAQNRQRIPVNLPIQMQNFNSNATFVGSTSEGDIAVATNTPNGPMLSMEVCQREGISSNAQISEIYLNNSLICSNGELVATVIIPGQFGNFTLRFHPEFFKQVCSQFR